jgi:hypothetical protein
MSAADYRVADISLADFGRKEIEIAGNFAPFNFFTSFITTLPSLDFEVFSKLDFVSKH